MNKTPPCCHLFNGTLVNSQNEQGWWKPHIFCGWCCLCRHVCLWHQPFVKGQSMTMEVANFKRRRLTRQKKNSFSFDVVLWAKTFQFETYTLSRQLRFLLKLKDQYCWGELWIVLVLCKHVDYIKQIFISTMLKRWHKSIYVLHEECKAMKVQAAKFCFVKQQNLFCFPTTDFKEVNCNMEGFRSQCSGRLNKGFAKRG